MSLNEKKRAILYSLSQESEPIGLQDLLGKLGDSYPERSVRRWLSEMVDKGVVSQIGQKRGTKYQVLLKNDRATSDCFSLESAKTIELVRRPLFERSPVPYADHWFEAYQPNKTFYVPPESQALLEQSGKRARREDPAGTYAHQIFNRLLIDLSYNSSRLEGNTYSLLDTERLLFEGSSAEGKLDEERIMILNHKEAIRYLVENASKLTISGETICTLHYLLSDGLVEPRLAGKVRDHAVRIGGSTYIPFEEKKALQIRLDRIIEKAALIENVFEQSFFLLVHMSYLQAFSDVNKRSARLCANIPLIKFNFVPQSFNDVERDDYTSAMIAIYELQEVRPLLDLYVFSYMRTCAQYDATVKAVGFDEVRVRYRGLRRDIVRHIIVNLLTNGPMDEYIFEAVKLIKEEERNLIIQDVLEDLNELDISRLAGLGVTPEQMVTWKNNFFR